MALLKNITNDKGVTSTYHRVDRITCTPEGETCRVTTNVVSYISQEIRATGVDNYVENDMYIFHFPVEDLEKTSVFKVVYDRLKTTEKFSNAEDC